MPKNLTRAAADSAAWFIEFNRKGLKREQDKGGSPGKLWRIHVELALNLYAEDAPVAEVREHFRQAAHHGVAAYERVTPPVGTKIRIPRDFCSLVGVVAAFGTDDERTRSAGVERWKWFHPETMEHTLLADTVEQVQSTLGRRFDPDRARWVLERLRGENVSREGVRSLAPTVTALISLNENDAAGLNAALRTMTAEHRYQSLHGKYQLSHDGLIAVVALGIARLAREHDISVEVDSPYLPLALLEP